MVEMITWITDPRKLPDDQETVLIAVHDEPCAEGFHDGEHWFWACGSQIPTRGVKAWATHSHRAGASLRDIQEHLGHSHLNTTMIYITPDPTPIRSPHESLGVKL